MSEETPEYGMRSGEVSKEESEALMKDRIKRMQDLHDNHGYFQGDNWKALKQIFKELKQ